MNRPVIFLLRIGIEVGVCTVSWKLVNWVASKFFNQFLSNTISAGWLLFCAKDRAWNLSPRTPEQRTHLRGIFWRIVPFPTIINRYNIWVGLVAEGLGAASAVYAANIALKHLFSSRLAGVLGHAISQIAFSDRAFELNSSPVPPAATNNMEGIMWKFIVYGLEKGAEKLLVHASTPAKRRRRSPRTTTELVSFPYTFPDDILGEILDATLHQIWEETDKERDPEFSDVVSLMLTCKGFKARVFPQFYSYIHLANPTRVSQLAVCILSIVNSRDGCRPLCDIPLGPERFDAYKERGPRLHALSLVDFTCTLDEHLDASATLSLMLPQLRRLNIHWSLLNQVRQRQRTTAFHAAQITIVMDEIPPNDMAFIAAHDARLMLVQQNIGFRFAYPLDASGKVPPAHRRSCASYDSNLISHISTKRIAIECSLEDEVDVEETERSKNFLQVFLRVMGRTIVSFGRFTRVVFIVWVGDEEYENWVDPQPEGELTAFETAVHDKFKGTVEPQNTEGVVSFVPLRKRELSQWSFSVLERNGLDFWEEIEKRIARRAATKESM